MSKSALQIGELAVASGVSVDTVRYYEKRKLIHCVSRTYGGFRLFDSHTIERIKFIKQAQEFGFSLDEIKGLLVSGGAEECQKMRDLLEQKLSEVDEQIRKMKVFRKTLSNHLAACETELSEKGINAACPAFIEIERGKK
jgi:DNA-binding transcriptional MerR regulator